MSGGAPFGRVRRADFLLEDAVDHLNHGGFGATPRVVLAAAAEWRQRMEQDPTAFFRARLLPLLREAAARVAGFLGGRGEDWAFVENATAGTNAVVAALGLAPGDEILCLSQVYGALANTLRHHAGRAGARVVELPVPVPFADPEPLLAALKAALGRHTRLAALDHVTSPVAIVLPLAEMAAICRVAGVPVLVDGAHAPGMLPLDVPSLGVDWYVGNLHKWAFAAKGTGIIWCTPERHRGLHPVAISHALGLGFTAEFDFTGTRDNSAWLAVPAALEYLERLGPAAVRDHNRRLASAAGEMLATAWRTEIAAAPAFRGAMAAVRLPGPVPGGPAEAARLTDRLRAEHAVSAPAMPLGGALWLRVSAQVYNEAEDYRRLAEIGPRLAR